MAKEMSKKMNEFIDKVDSLCWEYGYEIWPTDKLNARNEDGTYPTLTIHGDNEKIKLIYIDGDGRGK
tara:strand:+ start:534 stop:734 length:201 start_codon:yes stop_codon:yes gene_type:complete